MKRGLLTLFILAITCLDSFCEIRNDDLPRITYGAEWSYCAVFYRGYHYYFIAPEGYRIDDRGHKVSYHSNGEVYVHAGYNLNEKWNISLYAGYTGIGDFHTGIPVSLRMTRYFGDNPLKDRWFAYLDIGSGISIKECPQELLSGKAGGGYRFTMSRFTKLDLLAAIRFMHTHPDVDYYGEIILKEKVNRNIGYIVSASLGIGITF